MWLCQREMWTYLTIFGKFFLFSDSFKNNRWYKCHAINPFFFKTRVEELKQETKRNKHWIVCCLKEINCNMIADKTVVRYLLEKIFHLDRSHRNFDNI